MVEYRHANIQDLSQIAQIHKEQFPTHYLGSFSIILLKRFYSNLLRDDIIFIVASVDDSVLGFVLGGDLKIINGYLNEFIKKNVLRGICESAIRPKTWKKSFRKFWSFFSKKVEDPDNLDNKEKYTLLSIATCKLAQGKGVGSGLVSFFDESLKMLGNRYYLSVHDSNINAIRFYQKNGFVEAYSFPGEIQMIKTI